MNGGAGMSEPKPFASLSSGLLARKGSAKPAMRPQGFSQFNGNLEDLGWNDMGHGTGANGHAALQTQEHVPSSIAALTPAPKLGDAANGIPVPVEQQRTIAETFSPPAPDLEPVDLEAAEADPVVAHPEPVLSKALEAEVPETRVQVAPPAAKAPRGRRQPGQKDKAAFTLRLDAERHLKLRLACAVKHRSAQQIVSKALDEFLNSLPELEAITQQLPARPATNN